MAWFRSSVGCFLSTAPHYVYGYRLQHAVSTPSFIQVCIISTLDTSTVNDAQKERNETSYATETMKDNSEDLRERRHAWRSMFLSGLSEESRANSRPTSAQPQNLDQSTFSAPKLRADTDDGAVTSSPLRIARVLFFEGTDTNYSYEGDRRSAAEPRQSGCDGSADR